MRDEWVSFLRLATVVSIIGTSAGLTLFGIDLQKLSLQLAYFSHI